MQRFMLTLILRLILRRPVTLGLIQRLILIFLVALLGGSWVW